MYIIVLVLPPALKENCNKKGSTEHHTRSCKCHSPTLWWCHNTKVSSLDTTAPGSATDLFPGAGHPAHSNKHHPLQHPWLGIRLQHHPKNGWMTKLTGKLVKIAYTRGCSRPSHGYSAPPGDSVTIAASRFPALNNLPMNSSIPLRSSVARVCSSKASWSIAITTILPAEMSVQDSVFCFTSSHFLLHQTLALMHGGS